MSILIQKPTQCQKEQKNQNLMTQPKNLFPPRKTYFRGLTTGPRDIDMAQIIEPISRSNNTKRITAASSTGIINNAIHGQRSSLSLQATDGKSQSHLEPNPLLPTWAINQGWLHTSQNGGTRCSHPSTNRLERGTTKVILHSIVCANM